MTEQEKKSKPGPEEDRLKIEGDWKDAMKKSLEKERPEGGWPMGDTNFTIQQEICRNCGNSTPHKVTVAKVENGNRIERWECPKCQEVTVKP